MSGSPSPGVATRRSPRARLLGALVALACVLATPAHAAAPDSSRAMRAMSAPAAAAPAPATSAGPRSVDGLTLPDSVLTLAWLESATLERNPSLAARRSAVASARASARTRGALADPELEAMTAPSSWSSSPPATAYRIELSQRLPIFGQGGLERRAAVGGAEATAEDLATLQLDLLRETRTAYYDWYHAARQLDANNEQEALVTHLKDVALARYSSGLAAQGDVLSAEVEVAMLSHEHVLLERQRRVVLARLDQLLRLPQGTVLPPPPAELESLPIATHSDSGAAGRWPEVRAADLRIEQAQRELDLARRMRWPEPTVSLVHDRYMAEPEWRTSVGLALNLPISLPRLSDAESAALASLEAAEAERADALARESERLAVATATLEEARHEVAIMEGEVAPATARALSSLRAAYEAGNAPFTSVLAAARDAARARLDVHRAQAGLHQAEAEYLRATAGDSLAAAPASGGER